MNVSMHKDNAGALMLAEILPPQFTPCINHYANKTIWFRGEIFKRGINLVKIDDLHKLGFFLRKNFLRHRSNTSKINLWDGENSQLCAQEGVFINSLWRARSLGV